MRTKQNLTLIALLVRPTGAHDVNLCFVTLGFCFCLHVVVRTFQHTWVTEGQCMLKKMF